MSFCLVQECHYSKMLLIIHVIDAHTGLLICLRVRSSVEKEQAKMPFAPIKIRTIKFCPIKIHCFTLV